MKQWTRQPDFIRLIHSYGFWLSIAGVTAVVMGSNLTELEQQWEFRTVDTIMDNFLYGGWYRNLVFVVAAVPFARSYCQDTVHRFRDAMVQKMGIFRYAWSKVCHTALSAFLVASTGLLLSALIFSVFCDPCYYEKFGEMNYTYPYGMLAASGNTALYVVVRSMLFAMGAAFWSTFALVVSTWNPEPLTILAVPFIGSYIEERFLFFIPTWMQIAGCVRGEEIIPAGIAVNFLYGICFMLLLIVLLGILFYYRVKRSVYGEGAF